MLASVKIVWLALFTYLYGLGGIHGKYNRRFLGSLWLAWGVWGSAVSLGCFSWWLLPYYPLLVGALSLGYGADNIWDKVKKRFLYGAACTTAALPIVIINNNWLMFLWYGCTVIFTSVFLGVLNPTKNARWEETIIATAIGLSLFL